MPPPVPVLVLVLMPVGAAVCDVSMSKCWTRTSLMKPHRTGFMVCKGAKGPTCSSHHSAASASNLAVSRASTVFTPDVVVDDVDVDVDVATPRLPACPIASPPSTAPNLLLSPIIVIVAVVAFISAVVPALKLTFCVKSIRNDDDAARRQEPIVLLIFSSIPQSCDPLIAHSAYPALPLSGCLWLTSVLVCLCALLLPLMMVTVCRTTLAVFHL